MMKILVTGGAGYIGSHAAHQLVEAGHEVVVLDNLCTGHRWAVPKAADFVQGGIGDGSVLKALFQNHQFDALLHFAAHLEIAESVAMPAKYYRTNLVETVALVEAAREAGVSKVIFSSTAAVYGEPTDGLIREDHGLHPLSPYGASKMMAERILLDIARASGGRMKAVCLRYANAAGARADLRIGQATPKPFHLIHLAAQAAVGLRDGITIYGTDYPTADGTCMRDYVHVDDVARVHIDALKYLESGGESAVFNVGYGRLYSVRKVLETMKRVSGKDFRVVEGPRRSGDPAILGIDNSKLRQVLGWTPRYDDLELICKTAFEWEAKLQARGAINF